MPGHGAVLQRHDLVAHAGVDQRLRADDAARAAAAVDDDRGIRRRHEIGEAIDQLRAGNADRRGDAVVVILLERAAVVDRDIGLAIDQRLAVPRRISTACPPRARPPRRRPCWARARRCRRGSVLRPQLPLPSVRRPVARLTTAVPIGYQSAGYRAPQCARQTATLRRLRP